MKVFGTALTADIQTLEVQVENQWLPVQELIGPLCPIELTVVKKDADESYFWLKIANSIQGVRYTTGGLATTITTTTIDNDRTVGVTEFTNQTINMFNKGVNYMIPYSAGLVLPMTPPDSSMPINGSAGLYYSTHYSYLSGSDNSILGATSIADVWTYKIDFPALAKLKGNK